VQGLIRLRQAHKAFHRDNFFPGQNIPHAKVSGLTWLTPHGTEMTEDDWNMNYARCVGLILLGDTHEVDAQGKLVAKRRADTNFVLETGDPASLLARIAHAKDNLKSRIALVAERAQGLIELRLRTTQGLQHSDRRLNGRPGMPGTAPESHRQPCDDSVGHGECDEREAAAAAALTQLAYSRGRCHAEAKSQKPQFTAPERG
jgi:hypothetical protein